MLRYYIILTFRHMRRNLTYSLISIIGLAIGLCASILIGLYVKDELSYETWLPGYQDVYLVAPNTTGGRRNTAGPSDLGLWVKQDYPQLAAMARLFHLEHAVGTDINKNNERIAWADPEVFEVFEFETIYGSLNNALEQPSTTVLTESIAKKYFGDTNPVGQNLFFDNNTMQVTAVIKDLPSNTTLNFALLAASHTPWSITAEQDRNPLQGVFGRKVWNSITYIRTGLGLSPDNIESDLGNMLDRHLPLPEGRKNSDFYRLEIMPFANLHLASRDGGDKNVNLRGIYTVSAISLLILFAAVINYINLMTSRGIKRAPEIAVRKTLGAARSSLVKQFMVESSIHVGIALAIAMVISDIALIPFNSFLGREIVLNYIGDPQLLLGLGLGFSVTALLGGLYPAVVLSNFPPISLFRSNLKIGANAVIRQILSVLQFAILTGLFIATFTIYRQAQFGIDEALKKIDNPIVYFTMPCSPTLQTELEQQPFVIGAACSFGIPHFGIGPTSGMSLKNDPDVNADGGVHYVSVDPGFLQLYQVELLAGRHFDPDRAGDFAPEDNNWILPESIIINETLARSLGFETPEQAINQSTSWQHLHRLPNVFTPRHDAVIIGVVKDFQMGSVRNNIYNAVFYSDPAQARMVSVKIQSAQLPQAIAAIEQISTSHSDTGVVDVNFFEESVDALYRDIIKQSQLLGIYSTIAILIAALGLVGLAAFVAELRTKEIGIRKVCGGSRLNIVSLLLLQFTKPVLLSNLIAWPLAYYYLNLWLENFARRIDLSWWAFVGAGLATLLVATFTVGLQTYRAAGIQPVKALRYE